MPDEVPYFYDNPIASGYKFRTCKMPGQPSLTQILKAMPEPTKINWPPIRPHVPFIVQYIMNGYGEKQLNRAIDEWHEHYQNSEPLHVYLGMSATEYAFWIAAPMNGFSTIEALNLIRMARINTPADTFEYAKRQYRNLKGKPGTF